MILSWTDGDRALAFWSAWVTKKRGQPWYEEVFHETMRVLDLSATGGDLLADSHVVWQAPPTTYTDNQSGCTWGLDPAISSDGKTVVCMSVSEADYVQGKSAVVTLRLLAFPASASAPAPASAGRVLYKSTATTLPPQIQVYIGALRAGPSARTVLAQWYLFVPKAGVQRRQSAGHFGVITGGRFTALPMTPVYKPPPAVAIP